MRKVLGLITAVAITAAGNVFGEKAEAVRLPVPEDAVGEGPRFYSAFMKGTKIGWMSESSAIKKRVGREVICTRLETHTEAKAFGTEVTSVEVEEVWFDTEPPYKFLGGRKVSQSGGGLTQHIEVAPLEEGAGGAVHKVTVKEAGDSKERRWEPGDFRLADVTTATVWFRQGPKVGESVRVRALSIGGLETSVDTMTVTRAPGDDSKVKSYLADVVSSRQGAVGTVEVTPEGEILEMRVGGGAFVIRREKEEAVARAIEAAEVDMFVDNIVRMEKKLGHPGKITEMVLKITGTDVEKIPSGPNQLAEFDVDSEVMTLRIGKHHGVDSPAGEEALEEALEDTLLYPATDADVVKLAKKAVRKAGESDADRVAALIKFVDRYIVDDATAEPMTVADIMKKRRGDCTEHALLFVTLARALEIPAREVSGLFYADEIGGFGGHAWAEVALDGEWVPVDPAWNETWTNAAHIRIYTEGVSDFSQQALQISGDMKIEVDSMKRKK